eukprot:11556552-Alexandrium_andersonii.AAC.1
MAGRLAVGRSASAFSAARALEAASCAPSQGATAPRGPPGKRLQRRALEVRFGGGRGERE